MLIIIIIVKQFIFFRLLALSRSLLMLFWGVRVVVSGQLLFVVFEPENIICLNVTVVFSRLLYNNNVR